MNLSKELTVSDKVFIGILCAFAALAVGYMLFGKAAFVAFFKSQEAAAWVQAVGSIAAIAATGYWAVHQTTEARKLVARQHHLDDLSKTEAIHVLVSAVRLQIVQLHGAINNNSPIDAYRHSHRLSELRMRLSAINPLECPGSGNAIVVVDLPFRLHDLCSAADSLMAQRKHKTQAISVEYLTRTYAQAHHTADLMTSNALKISERQRDNLIALAGVTDFEE